jgi:SAM-dependent methyltransferase
MSTPNYEYHGLKVSTWDLWRGDTSNWSDRHFYLDIVREFGQPVLDVGCGTGRILLDYLGQGIDIDGVDNSPEMLAACREKAARFKLSPSLFQQEMNQPGLPRTYRTILVPSSTFTLIADADEAREAMRRFFAHLQPRGALVMSVGSGPKPGEPLDTGWKLLFERVRADDGATIRSWTREWHEPEKSLWHCDQKFEVILDGKLIDSELHRRSPAGRSYTQTQAIELFEAAGFADVRLYHDFSREPAREDDRLFCALGVKP